MLLDNGQVCYGKIAGLGAAFPKMTDVYYIVNTEDAKTKQVKHGLVRRGKVLHAPTETFPDARHIIMIEPVGTQLQVARLIAESDPGFSGKLWLPSVIVAQYRLGSGIGPPRFE